MAMLYHRTGFPEEGEILWCRVTNIQHSSIFCEMLEYGTSGMIHISEVVAGRVRNIRDFVKEGKIVVCKVLRTYKDRGHVDLSLRRVSEMQRRNKGEEMKQEAKAEKLVEFVAKQIKVPFKELYNKIAPVLLSNYQYIFLAFEEVSKEKENLEKLGIDPKYASTLTEIIKQRIKPQILTLGGTITLQSYDSNGLKIVKEALSKAEKGGVAVRYLGAGNFKLNLQGEDVKAAEKKLNKAVEEVVKFMEDNKGTAEFSREETRV